MYKRITAYTYSYENGERLCSCGYCRFDICDNKCKVFISIKIPEGFAEKSEEIYLVAGDKTLKKEALGTAQIEGGSICYRQLCDTACMTGSICMDNVSGVLIYNEENPKRVYYCNLKGEEPYIPSLLNAYTDTEADITDIDTTDTDTPDTDTGITDIDTSDTAADTSSWQELLFSKFPKVRVSFDGEISEAIKMRPHDLVWFPRKYWRFSNNRCLLDGYYNYRYIMLVRGAGEREGSYYLAVPGKNMVNEAISARKQGFSEFVTGKGDLGFWCCRVGQ